MKPELAARRRRRSWTWLAAILVCSASLNRMSVGDSIEARDGCEIEALRAYSRALKLCELAEVNPNPRLRCYEAARAVYLQTLQECRNGPR